MSIQIQRLRIGLSLNESTVNESSVRKPVRVCIKDYNSVHIAGQDWIRFKIMISGTKDDEIYTKEKKIQILHSESIADVCLSL